MESIEKSIPSGWDRKREGNREQKVAKQLIIQLYNLFLSKKEKENKKWFTKSEEMKVKRKRETGGVARRVWKRVKKRQNKEEEEVTTLF